MPVASTVLALLWSANLSVSAAASSVSQRVSVIAVPAARSTKNAPPAFPGSFATKPLTWSFTCASHLSIASGEPDHVDVLANTRNLQVAATGCPPPPLTLSRISLDSERSPGDDELRIEIPARLRQCQRSVGCARVQE